MEMQKKATQSIWNHHLEELK